MAIDMLKRSLELLKNSAISTGKNYMSNVTELVSDANDIKNQVTDGMTQVADVYRKMSKGQGPLRKIANWFYERGDQYGDFDSDDDQFDAGFDTTSDDSEKPSAVLDTDSMRSITRGQVGAMYQIGGKQVEANAANTAEIITSMNSRTSEINASLNNMNKTLLSIDKKLEAMSKVIAYSEEKKETQYANTGIYDSSGNIRINQLFTGMRQGVSDNMVVGTAKMALQILGMGGPAGLTDLLVGSLADKKFIKLPGQQDKVSISEIGEKLNDVIGNVVQSSLSRLVSWGPFKKVFGDLTKNPELGRNYARFAKNEYTRDKAVFDGITRKTIVSIIPEYLSKITAVLTGQKFYVTERGQLSTSNTDHFAKMTFSGTSSMGRGLLSDKRFKSLVDDEAELGTAFTHQEIRMAMNALVSVYTWFLSDDGIGGVNPGIVEQYRSRVIPEAIQWLYDAYGTQMLQNGRTRSDWDRLLNRIVKMGMDDSGTITRSESNRFMSQLTQAVAKVHSQAVRAAQSEQGASGARTLKKSDFQAAFVQFGKEYTPYATSESDLSKEGREKFEADKKKQKELESAVGGVIANLKSDQKKELEEIKRRIATLDYKKKVSDEDSGKREHEGLIPIVQKGMGNLSHLEDLSINILKKLHDIIRVKIVKDEPNSFFPDWMTPPPSTAPTPVTPSDEPDPGSNPSSPSQSSQQSSPDDTPNQPDETKTVSEQVHEAISKTTEVLKNATNSLSDKIHEMTERLDPDSISGKLARFLENKRELASKPGDEDTATRAGHLIDKAGGFASAAFDAVTTRGASIKQWAVNKARSIKNDISERIHSNLDYRLATQERAKEFKNKRELISKDETISAADKQYADMAMGMMQVAMEDGEGKSDIAKINKPISKIKNQQLKEDLQNAVKSMMDTQAQKEEKPAKSKLGKILLWALGGLKTLFKPVIKLFTKGFNFFKNLFTKGVNNVMKGLKGIGSKLLDVLKGLKDKLVEKFSNKIGEKAGEKLGAKAGEAVAEKAGEAVATKAGEAVTETAEKAAGDAASKAAGAAKGAAAGAAEGALSGAAGGPIAALVSGLAQIVLALEGGKALLEVIGKVLFESLEPISDLLVSLVDMLKPVLELVTDVLKAVLEPLVEVLDLVIDLVAPILKLLSKAISKIVTQLMGVISPTLEFVANALKALLGAASLGIGYLLKLGGALISIVGGIVKLISFGTVDAVSKIGEAISGIADALISYGKQNLQEGISGVFASVSDFITGFDNLVNPQEEVVQEREKRVVENEELHGSAMDGLTGNGDTYSNNTVNNYYHNLYGSGNTSQYSYGTYMGMRDHGCGPIALADAYGRRTGNAVNPLQLASAMRGSGTYDSSNGTSVGNYMRAAGALGMGVVAGGVTQQSLKHASPTNPITVLGSGSGFGTRSGNNHYMNVIGSKDGISYVSNPLTGRVGRVPTSAVVGNSVLGLYGSGDSEEEFAKKYHLSDAVADAFGALKDLAANFFSIFTKAGDADDSEENDAKEQQLRSQLKQRGVNYDDLYGEAFALFQKENPKGANESQTAYNSRWNRKKQNYMIRVASEKLGELTKDNPTLKPTLISDAEQATAEKLGLSPDEIISQMNEATSDSAAYDDAVSKWDSAMSSQAAANSGDAGSYSGSSNFVPRLEQPESGNKFYNNAPGGYNTIMTMGSDKSGKSMQGLDVLPNCAGYALGRFHESVNQPEFKHMQRKYGSRDGGSWVATAKSEGLQVDTTGNDPKPGDAISWKQGDKSGHVAIVEQVPDDKHIVISHSGYNSNMYWKLDKLEKSSDASNPWPIWKNNSKGIPYVFSGFIHNPDIQYYSGELLDGSEPEAVIYDYLTKNGATPIGATGMMGCFKHESGFRSNNLEDTFQSKWGYAKGETGDTKYTADVDSGTESEGSFVNSHGTGRAGYGIAQFTASNVKQDLYNRTVKQGKSISDLAGQLDAIVGHLGRTKYGSGTLLNAINNAASPTDANKLFLWRYEAGTGFTSDEAVANAYPWMGMKGIRDRHNAAENYYTRYKNGAHINKSTQVDTSRSTGTAAGDDARNRYIDSEVGRADGVPYNYKQNNGGFYSVSNKNDERLFSAWDMTGQNSNAISAFEKQYSDEMQFLGTIPGLLNHKMYAFSFDNSYASRAAKEWIKNQSKSPSSGSSSSPSQSTGSSNQSKTDLRAYIINRHPELKGTMWEDGEVPTLSGIAEFLASGYPWNKTVVNGQIMYNSFANMGTATHWIDDFYDRFDNPDRASLQSWWNFLNPISDKNKKAFEFDKIFGGGDSGPTYIPAIDYSKFNDSIGSYMGQFGEVQTPTVNNITVMKSDEKTSTAAMVNAVLSHTFSVQSASIEKLLNVIVDELKSRRQPTSTPTQQQSPESMFDNSDIPTQVKKLITG
jgi:hypothetical protein